MAKERSEKHEKARGSLPEELQPIFDQFVEDYKFAGTIHHGSPFVSYIVLAEMVKAGWRPTGEPVGQWRKSEDEQRADSDDGGK
ncbi:MAG: hypothetical protein RBS80_13765 [Thermoguttaceae bacterium]|jgi:hypothetical protein|nr:hypothetical protein [Thermoguttaceae bacterium]